MHKYLHLSYYVGCNYTLMANGPVAQTPQWTSRTSNKVLFGK